MQKKIKMLNYNYEIKSQNDESTNSNYETYYEIKNQVTKQQSKIIKVSENNKVMRQRKCMRVRLNIFVKFQYII